MTLKETYIKWLKQPVYYHSKCRPRYYHNDYFESFPEFDENESKLNDFDGDIWFISDYHFGHKNILSFSKRPFNDLDDMENKLVEFHNMMVKPEDIVINVGDFSLCNRTESTRIMKRMNGYKILVLGNHDVQHRKFKNTGWDEVYVCKEMVYNDVTLKITHFPLMDNDDGINVHGHVHVDPDGLTSKNAFRGGEHHHNVNCEFINYVPIHIDKIVGKK